MEHHNGEIMEYRVNVTEIRTGRVRSFSTPITQLIVTGLRPYFLYECIVSAVTVAEGPYSAALVVRTHQAGKGSSTLKTLFHIEPFTEELGVNHSLYVIFPAPSTFPQNISVTFVTSRSIGLSWAPLEEDSRNGIVRGYNVTVSDSVFSRRLVSTTEEFTVPDLEPFTRYVVTVAAHTIATGPFSPPLEVTTQTDGRSCDGHVTVM